MPTQICPPPLLTGEFVSAIAGAIVGGVIAFAIQMKALAETRKQRKEDIEARQKALGHALVLKMIRIYSHLRGLNGSVEDSIQSAKKAGVRGDQWQLVIPIANPPEFTHFSTDELAMLLSLKDFDIFDAVAPMDERHNTTIVAFNAYRDRRQQLATLMPSEMKGDIGTVELTQQQMRAIGPVIVELNSLLEAVIPQCKRQEREAWDALTRLRSILSSKIGITIDLKEKDDVEFRPTRAEARTVESITTTASNGTD